MNMSSSFMMIFWVVIFVLAVSLIGFAAKNLKGE